MSTFVETDFSHEPVLLQEVLAQAAHAGDVRQMLDCTVGGGGHSAALLDAFPNARLLGIDRDLEALKAAGERLSVYGDRVTLVHGCCSALRDICEEHEITQTVDVMLADFGVSSHQIDTPERGFSFRHDGPLDMRMDQSHGEPVWSLLESMDERDLASAIKEFGEERHATRVARALIADKPKTTGELAQIVHRVVPFARDGLDTATRTFQGLRMLVNDEAHEVGSWVKAVPYILRPGGVAIAISFHSGEDRLVKQGFQNDMQHCVCPPSLPVCLCHVKPVLAWLAKGPVMATQEELARNVRSRSAKLRAVIRLGGSA